MRALLVVAHPLDNAFAKAAAERIRAMLERRGIEVDMIDLYADDFDPRLTGAERRGYFTTPYDSRAVAGYIARLRLAEKLVFVFPQWWFNVPACKAVADSLEEAGDKLFTFPRFPESQWKSIRTSNGIERLPEEFKRRIKTQTVLPSAETAAMLFWALLASGQTTMRKVDGWRSLNERPSDQTIDLAA